MTVITLHGLETALGSPEPLKVGRFVGEPWAGTSSHIRVDGADVEFPRQVVVAIEDGDPVTAIDLPVLPVPWKVWIEDLGRGRKTTPRYVLVPESGPVDWADLIDVDPTTFEPTDDIVTAWQAAIDEVTAIRNEVASMAVTATIDPEDPDVLILTFPSFMTGPDDDSILVLPIGA